MAGSAPQVRALRDAPSCMPPRPARCRTAASNQQPCGQGHNRAHPCNPLPCSVYDAILPHVYAALTRVVMASRLPDSAWYSAAESALTAVYTLHPAPEHLSAAILRQLARRAFAPAARQAEGTEAMEADDAPAAAGGHAEGEQSEASGADGEQDAAAEGRQEGGQPAESQQTGGVGGSQAPVSMHSVVALTRFFFALGHIALQHLVRGPVREGPDAACGAGLNCWVLTLLWNARLSCQPARQLPTKPEPADAMLYALQPPLRAGVC